MIVLKGTTFRELEERLIELEALVKPIQTHTPPLAGFEQYLGTYASASRPAFFAKR